MKKMGKKKPAMKKAKKPMKKKKTMKRSYGY